MREINYDSIKAKAKKLEKTNTANELMGYAEIRDVEDLIVLRLYFDTVKARVCCWRCRYHRRRTVARARASILSICRFDGELKLFMI